MMEKITEIWNTVWDFCKSLTPEQVWAYLKDFFWGINGVIAAVIVLIWIIALWKVFKKAGKGGWRAIIPIVNIYTLVKIADGKGLKFLLLLIPIVGLIYWLIVEYRLAKSFGKGFITWLGLIILNPIFMLILGFGGSKYLGPHSQRKQN